MLDTASMRLSRLGDAVPFHVEPRSDRFVPGSTLFFLADGSDAAYTNDAVYELAVAPGGLRMAVGASSRGRSALPAAPPLSRLLASHAPSRQNVDYLPALLDAQDLWLWTRLPRRPAGIDYPFSLAAPRPRDRPAPRPTSRAAATPPPTPTTTSASPSTAPPSPRPTSTA